MSIISLFLVIIFVGVALWLVNAFVPMDARVKQILNVAVIILLVVWILVHVLGGTELGRVRI